MNRGTAMRYLYIMDDYIDDIMDNEEIISQKDLIYEYFFPDGDIIIFVTKP